MSPMCKYKGSCEPYVYVCREGAVSSMCMYGGSCKPYVYVGMEL